MKHHRTKDDDDRDDRDDRDELHQADQVDQTDQADETTPEDGAPPADPDTDTDITDTDADTDTEPDMFPREYVEQLRQESGGYRTQLRDAQEELHRMKVDQTGRLADPADLPFDVAHLDDPAALEAAIDQLLHDRPHLRARRVIGDAGQGNRGAGANSAPSLLGLLQGRP